MTRRTLAAIMLIALPSAEALADGPVRRTFQIDLSARETMKTRDWSGKAEISKGRILQVDKTSGNSDTIHADKSWTIVYGRSLKGQPKVQPRPKALLITVQAEEDAVITCKTKGGVFAFTVGEIPPTKKVEKLGGDVLVSVAKARPRGGRKRPRPAAKPAKIAGELKARRLTDGTRPTEWPALAIGPDGVTWTACVAWDRKKADRVIVLRHKDGKAVGAPIVLDDGGWDHYWPAIALAGGKAVVVWTSRIDGNADLYWSTISADGKPAKPQRLTTAEQTDFHARLAADAKGTVTLVWQSFRGGQSDIYGRRYAGGAWGDEVRLSPSDRHDWQPSLAVDAAGSAWVSWDSYDRGNYDVFLRRFDANGPGPVIPITSEPTAQFHSSVAVDGRGRVWVAWDDAGPNWGKDLSTSSAAEGYKGLHAVRTIGLRVYAAGTVRDVTPQPGSVLTGAMARMAELPQLAVDGQGTLWMVFRHWTIRRPTEMYHVYATRLTADGWAVPWRLADSSGRNTQWTDIARDAKGTLQVAYASDGRAPDNLPTDQIHALTYQVYQAALPMGQGPGKIELADARLPKPTTKFVRRVRPTMTVGGKTYTLLFGDCHRHTDIRGHSAVDASVMDTFRYALDAGQLDFMGLGDHNEIFGGRWPDGLRDYQWWWTQKAVDLFTCPPTFVGLFSYEHSMASPGGHRNIIFLKRGAPLRAVDRGGKAADNPANQPPELWKWVRANVLTQPGQKCVIVPHTFAAGPLASWNWPNAEFDCLLEIYQGCRGSYEKWNQPKGEKRGGTQTKKPGHFAQDALAKGNVYGFVSFSDHRSTHNSWAGVWAETISRDGLLSGMLARRTFGASDEITVKLTANGAYTMGQKITAKANEPFELAIDVAAPDKLRRVDVVKNGLYIWTKEPKGKTFKASFRDMNVKPGHAYYYIRVFQRDPEKPEGDPEMAWCSPIFVTFK